MAMHAGLGAAALSRRWGRGAASMIGPVTANYTAFHQLRKELSQ
jgi:hypothetical protein